MSEDPKSENPSGEKSYFSEDSKRKPSSEKKEDKVKNKDKKKGSIILENIEAFMVAVILALIIRHYSMEAFVIPTGSMAPTLYGIHMKVRCPNCKISFDVGNSKYRSSDKLAENFVCPNCKYGLRNYEENIPRPLPDKISKSGLIGGHKILVNKFIYHLRDPQRWEVIVFKSPEAHHRNFIKRLIGLPGDTLQIFHGDLFLLHRGKLLFGLSSEFQKTLDQERFSRKLKGEFEKNKKNILDPAVRSLVPGERWLINSGYRGKLYWIDREKSRLGVYSAHWQIERKPDRVQQYLWMSEYDSSYREELKGRLVWDSPEDQKEKVVCTGCGNLLSVDKRFKIDGGHIQGDFRKKEGRLRYHRPVKDLYGYNIMVGLGGNPVGDLRILLKGTLQEKGVFSIQLMRPIKTFTVKIDFARGRVLLEDLDKGKVLEKKATLEIGKEYLYDFCHVDGQVILKIDQKEIFRYQYESPRSVEYYDQDRYRMILGFSGSRIDFQEIKLWRDIHYTDSPGNYGVHEPLALKGDEYFAMGDNSPNSQDSRQWGRIPAKNMLGKAFMVFWPAIPFYNWEARWIR